MTPAIVLAAGASSRMGRPKALLERGGRTFVRGILETLRDAGIADAVVVVRPGSPRIVAEIATAGFGRAVENARPEDGQLSSLLAGLTAIDRRGVDAVLVTLVDVPLVRADTIRTLLAQAKTSTAPIVRAVCGGRHGHPVIFKRAVFDALRRADLAAGAKTIFRDHPVDDVDVGDPGVLQDVDTPADYARLTGSQ